ncbi:hypothetical protein ACRS6Z_15375, partial [Bacillus cytotoxicus]|uniref:hypothetical protein n=1 Tax=Bacillus cytotoxicus TaxID=580165 RepID=UPI003D7D7657
MVFSNVLDKKGYRNVAIALFYVAILSEPLPLLVVSSSSGKNVRWLRAFQRGKERLYVRSS